MANKDCRNCVHFEECPCGKQGHEKGTSFGYSIGECKDYNDVELMSVEEYRRKLIEAFHNSDHDELIPIVVLPIEKEFEHLEWLLKNHWKDKSTKVE